MKKCFLVVIFLLVCRSVWAGEDYVKVSYYPGRIRTGKVTEVSIKPFGEGQRIVSDVYAKLTELQKTGKLDYVGLDASMISIEVSYKGEILKSSFTQIGLPSNKDEYDNFSRLWNAAYAIVWESIEQVGRNT